MSARMNNRFDDKRRGGDDYRRPPRNDRNFHPDRPPPPSQRYDEHDFSHEHRPSKRARPSTNNADPEKERLEQERKARMARLRAENQEEEAKLAQLESASSNKTKRMNPKEQIIAVQEEELEGLDEEEQMQKLLGFSGGFASTKGEEVEDNSKSAARGAAAKNKARKYRQYMNRKGGFDRPLDKMK